MAKSFAALVNEVERKLEDSSNATWSAASIGSDLEDAVRELSEYLPYEMIYIYTVESRTGTASATTADALVDSDEGQFLSTDVGKIIYNPDDNTFAEVTAYVSANQLTLSKDIMTVGEAYEMFNEGCHDSRQINIKDIKDYVGPEERGIFAIEYPTMRDLRRKRTWIIEGDILTIDLISRPDDTKNTTTDKEVYIWVEARQRLSQLTDLVGAIDNGAGYAAGSTTLHVDDFASAETIAEDTLLTIAGVRGTYRVIADATLSSNEIDILIHPALIDAAAEDDVITVIGSTLDRELERLITDLTAARAATNKLINAIVKGDAVYNRWENKLALVLSQLERLRNRRAPRTNEMFPTALGFSGLGVFGGEIRGHL